VRRFALPPQTHHKHDEHGDSRGREDKRIEVLHTVAEGVETGHEQDDVKEQFPVVAIAANMPTW
jgi:hypothetical protein